MQDGSGCGCGSGMGEKCGGKCGCFHHKVPMAMVVLFGLLFLGKTGGWVSADTVNWIWPILVIIGALSKMCGGGCKCCGMVSKM